MCVTYRKSSWKEVDAVWHWLSRAEQTSNSNRPHIRPHAVAGRQPTAAAAAVTSHYYTRAWRCNCVVYIGLQCNNDFQNHKEIDRIYLYGTNIEAEAFEIFSWLVLTFIVWPLITRQLRIRRARRSSVLIQKSRRRDCVRNKRAKERLGSY